MTVSRTSPDGQCRNQIEAGNEQAEISAKTRPGADCGTGHKTDNIKC